MALFGVRGSPDDSPRSRRAVQRSGIASKKLSSASITTTGKASSGTVNLNRLTGERVHITGTTTITEFQLEKGEFRRLIFDDALTLTYNASLLLLPGSASITTSAGDTCEAEGVDGTIVRIISYQRGGVPPPIGASKTANVRLTLESGVPISTTDQTAKSTLYATPYLGNYVPIYNGSSWQDVAFSEMSFSRQITITGCATTNGSPTLDLTNADKTNLKLLSSRMHITGTNIPVYLNLSSVAADGNSITMAGNATGTGSGLTMTFSMLVDLYDVFVILSNGSPTLRVNSWASATSRRDGLILLNGIYVNDGATTGNAYSPIPSNLGTYLGTVAADTFGGSDGFIDSAAQRRVWNFFNRKPRPVVYTDTTDTWNYSTAAYRTANNTGVGIVVVRGLDEDGMMVSACAFAVNSTATGRVVRVGIGIDSATVNSASVYDSIAVTNTRADSLKASYVGYPGLGRHDIYWLEYGTGTADTQTWHGDNGGIRQAGIFGSAWC